MYNKFIKLTERYSMSDERAVWINATRIYAFHIWASGAGDLTRIRMSDDMKTSIDVTETPTEIIKMIGELGE